ncbi:hypothetical protein [uncultured Microscilla sp.]|uniref:hypothetical protein n=1 Tax=uncultured Microscilla sp. TaxID=432653 RepID=UPI002633E7A5|nr:hypothetical protein [uncultured Microscilla sp.]
MSTYIYDIFIKQRLANQLLRLGFILLLLCPRKTLAQDATQMAVPPEYATYKPVGYFIQDSSAIGVPLYYSLSFKHPAKMEVIFPGKEYFYDPFDFYETQYFPTKTTSGGSLDSVVYKLATFEIDKVQKIALPVFILTPKDCVTIYAEPDSIILKELVKGDLKELSTRENAQPRPLKELVNYPYWVAGFSLFAIVLLVGWLALGKRIRRALSLYQFQARHTRFLREFNRLSNRFASRKAINDIEKALTIWKKHLEYIEDKPFSTYTSKEISQVIPNTELAHSLKMIDRVIYGKSIASDISESLEVLKEFSILRYETKQESLRDA